MQEQGQLVQSGAQTAFFLPGNVSQGGQQILQLGGGSQGAFLQSLRVPVSSVTQGGGQQWTVSNVLSSQALSAPQQQIQNLQGSRILFSQGPGTNEHFIMQNRGDITQTSIGVNQRFIPAHSLVVAQQLPNQIKQFSVNPSQIQIPIQHQNNGTMTQLHRINTPVKPDVLITQISSAVSHDSVNGQINYDKNNVNEINNGSYNANNLHTDPKLQNSHSFINHKRLSELVQGLDPHLQLDDDVQEVFNSFLEEFLLHVTDKALEISKLRSSNTVETKDFQYVFEHDWGVFVPGYQNCAEKPKKSVESEIHKLRMALIKKQCKK